MMTHPASATSALPYVDIHFDDLILTGALPALVAGAYETAAHAADAAILDLARPPLSDEVDEEATQDSDDDEDEDDEDEDEDDEDEDDEEEDDRPATTMTTRKKTRTTKTRMTTTTMTTR